jgi:hypothetical protein
MKCRLKEKRTTSAMADVQIVDPLACLAKQDAYRIVQEACSCFIPTDLKDRLLQVEQLGANRCQV